MMWRQDSLRGKGGICNILRGRGHCGITFLLTLPRRVYTQRWVFEWVPTQGPDEESDQLDVFSSQFHSSSLLQYLVRRCEALSLFQTTCVIATTSFSVGIDVISRMTTFPDTENGRHRSKQTWESGTLPLKKKPHLLVDRW